MESLAPSGFSGDAEKLPLASPLPTKASPASASVSDEIPTPEKRIQLPRRASKRSLCFSANDVRRIAMGMRRTRSEAPNLPDLSRFDGEPQLKTQPCSDSGPVSSSARNTGKLPEKYELLAEFFNCLDSSIRLLRLKGVSSTFANISASIQHLTERRFTYRHLAQLIHIMPESISIKKILLRDEITCCMKPELLVSLQVDAVERKLEIKGEGAYSALRKVFRARLYQFSREHPEEDDIPEETLPHPFGYINPYMSTESIESIPSILNESASMVHPSDKLTTVSHFSVSFQKRFSQRTPCSDEMKSSLASLNGVAIKADSLASSSPTPIKFPTKLSIHNKPLFSSPRKRPLKMDNQKSEEDLKMVISPNISPSKREKSLESTPVKEIFTPVKLMTTTPELQTPKKSCISTINDTPQREPLKRATRTRLFPTPRKNVNSDDADMSENLPAEDDVLGFLPEYLLQDIKKKEKIAMEERETNAAGARLRKKMISNLPKLLNSILLIFQSGNRSVITKQELVHKILASHCSLVDRSEVEEQLLLMQELVPDWISQKITVTGDILYRLNKTSSTQEIRKRLALAK